MSLFAFVMNMNFSKCKQIEGTRFIFEPRTIQRMELIVLVELDWRLRSVTPFAFVDFFAFKVGSSGRSSRILALRACQIILSAIHGNANVFFLREQKTKFYSRMHIG